MIEVSLHAPDLRRFNSALARYMEHTKMLPEEVLEKKGRDLGIRLFEGFREHQFGGNPKKKGIARAEAQARFSSGRGTKVRSSLLKTYARERDSMNAFARSTGQKLRRFKGTLDQWSDLKRQQALNRQQRSHLWRQIVGREIALRQSGIGVLATSFLWYRKRTSRYRGTYYVKNRTGRALGYVEKGADFLRIVSQTDGADKVDSRYSIVASAIAGATDDMLQYIQRKEREAFQKAFSAA